MKNKIFGGIAVLAIAAVAAWNVNFNSQKNDLSDVSLSNLEALAQEINWSCLNGCYSGYSGCYCYGWYANEREANTFF